MIPVLDPHSLVFLPSSLPPCPPFSLSLCLWRKGFVLQLPGHMPSLSGLRKETRREKPEAEAIKGLALLLMICSPCVFIQPRITCPGLVSPVMGWALPPQSLVDVLQACLLAKLMEVYFLS